MHLVRSVAVSVSAGYLGFRVLGLGLGLGLASELYIISALID